jgi:glycosyltransferase involved in cell wall biosynthesis
VFRTVEASSPAILRALLCHNVEDHESGPVRRFLSRGAFLSAQAFVVHAESDRRRLDRTVPGLPVAVLPHPVVSAPRPDRDRSRRELGVSSPLVLFLGLVRRYKGVDLLLRAAPQIVRETNARIAVVGEVFPEARDLEEEWKVSPVRDSVLWRDEYVTEEEMARWLAACDVVVLPYRYVSGSGIAARAIAAGRPMAASSVGGLSETVRPGVTGETFEPGDPAALAGAVQRVLENGISRYEPGLALAAGETSWARYVEGLLAFFADVRSPH